MTTPGRQTVPIGPEGTATVTLNGSGNGTAQAGPLTARERWSPGVASVSAATNTAEAQCKIIVGSDVATGRFADGTLSGSTGDSTDAVSASDVPCGTYVFAVWAGGDPGTLVTLEVTGTKTI